MDRNLKERMVGAVVLVATAVILIPEMLSGPRTAPETKEVTSLNGGAPASEDSAKLKTYTIDLAKSQSTFAPPTADSPSPGASKNASASPAAENVIATPAPPPEESANRVIDSPAAEISRPSQASIKENEPRSATPPTAVLPPAQGNWAVQVGSFGVRSTSERVAADLKRQGFSAFVVAFQASNQTMYRVRVGPERDRAAAEALMRKLKVHHPNATLVPPT